MNAAQSVGHTLGLELEMVVACRATGASHPVARHFESLRNLRRQRGESVQECRLGARLCGVGGPHGLSGLDNGYNLLETAFAPVNGGAGGLRRLAEAVRRELRDTQLALAAEGAMLINAAEHPAASLDADWYRRVRVPRPIYEELVGQRGWLHRIGIDAKAQNSPCTSVPVAIAARCLNVVLALAPAQIAMFANSPLEAGRVTGLKENRLTLWPRMFRGARYLGDDLLHRLPARPFRDLGDYFRWMFGGLTSSRALPPGDACDYKNADVACLVGAPSLAEFLYAGAWPARNLNDGGSVRLAARSEHFVYSQFAQFLDARWRYRMPIVPALPALLRAWDRQGGLEALFEQAGAQGYIEGRAPGAVFADADLLRSAGDAVAASAPMAASALQLGLLRNLHDAETLVRRWGWLRLRALRDRAIALALDDAQVRCLCQQVVAVAEGGLAGDEQQWLDYVRYVVETGETAADRMLRLWRQARGTPEMRRAQVCRQRAVLS
ncbi:glutamate-cysteine ligase family protein [Bordetella bronchiseptica]|uniref:Glutamate--cysteine ligase n=1 Tax=Bordetella bronchiseptica (strain ATCC BAA-588 / NCTC 13252 / RB50) TaxID=257310 RepID=A0A0H3LQ31_BORBR|nr:glutamate-cysteine ligase family protein [Bordetella bronchiseptica]KAK65158.1 glutamate-cysteine ligase, type2 domain protein [Bordetella bronchiseptica 980-2]AMG88033.1 hypothetical protein AL472_09660 [Bordetella bronchiseptica]KCV49609.1 glutamate-cysteine ligase, type2 domain protein [Bordetella bronchiseptica 3E44]KDB87120.1 glutamate-cysteine ligase, type2 domain protein [Bordetella bronchiseptica D989]KDB87653.1 glutamate-cysteine ligase, type2 domain protein [Bordetella bronchisept